MDEELEGRGWPAGEVAARALVRVLRTRDSDALFAFLLMAAARRQWEFVALTLEEMSSYAAARGIRILGFRPKPIIEWMDLYRLTSLPPILLPLFIDVIRFANPMKGQPDGLPTVERSPKAVIHAAFAIVHPGIEEDKERLRAILIGR